MEKRDKAEDLIGPGVKRAGVKRRGRRDASVGRPVGVNGGESKREERRGRED